MLFLTSAARPLKERAGYKVPGSVFLPSGGAATAGSRVWLEMPDDFQLSDSQCDKLFSFIEEVDQIFSDGSFRRDEIFDDAALLALALKAAQLWGPGERKSPGFSSGSSGLKM